MSAYRDIANLIDTEGKITDKLESCMEDPAAYYEAHKDEYKERFIEEMPDEDTVIWIGLVDMLIEAGIVYEFDWKVDLEDFMDGIHEISDIDLDEDIFDEDDGITDWARILADEYPDVVFAGLDISSDSYCTFFIDRESFNSAVEAADSIGHSIKYVYEM